jgi:hypothetical protein
VIHIFGEFPFKVTRGGTVCDMCLDDIFMSFMAKISEIFSMIGVYQSIECVRIIFNIGFLGWSVD